MSRLEIGPSGTWIHPDEDSTDWSVVLQEYRQEEMPDQKHILSSEQELGEQ